MIARAIEKGWPGIVAGALLLTGYLQARGVNQLVRAELAPPPAPAATPVAVAPLEDEVDGDPILEHNIFDSTPADAIDDSEHVPDDEVEEPPIDQPLTGAPKCDFGSVTVILSAADDYGFASITTKDGKSRLRRVGDSVDDHRVIGIAHDRIWLEGSSSRCQMKLGDPIAAAKKKRRPRRRPKRKRPRRRASTRLPKSIADKIEKVSDTEYRVDRSAIDAIIAKQAELMRRTRIIPMQGKTTGIRVARVRSGDLLDAIGVKSGDVIQTINGFDLSDPQKALEAYGRLRTANKLEVQVQRKGKPVTLSYEII